MNLKILLLRRAVVVVVGVELFALKAFHNPVTVSFFPACPSSFRLGDEYSTERGNYSPAAFL